MNTSLAVPLKLSGLELKQEVKIIRKYQCTKMPYRDKHLHIYFEIYKCREKCNSPI